jgi:hypothetical protein
MDGRGREVLLPDPVRRCVARRVTTDRACPLPVVGYARSDTCPFSTH